MKRVLRSVGCLALAVIAFVGGGLAARAADTVFQGQSAYGGYTRAAPGNWYKITPADLPPPFQSQSASNAPSLVERPAGTMPQVSPGFSVSVFAEGFRTPRAMKTAPNGDVFLAESGAGRIRVLRPRADGGKPTDTVFADVPTRPYGIAFFPPGPNPQYVYVASTKEVVRFPYRVGDTRAREPAQPVIRGLPSGGHWTRDILAAPDGQHLLLAIGSSANITDRPEPFRAAILEYNPDGSRRQVFATGLRNPVSIAIDPVSGALWADVNERDDLGNDLPPDYATQVERGGFYGWPWFYIGNHRDSRVTSSPPVSGSRVIVPDVLIQPHSAPIGMAFYTGERFPADYHGDLFVALHGSWNRSLRTGYKVIRVKMQNGHATGEYEDFMTGFVTPEGDVWGRPTGVAVMQDGSLLVSDDGSGTIWRIAYVGGATANVGVAH